MFDFVENLYHKTFHPIHQNILHFYHKEYCKYLFLSIISKVLEGKSAGRNVTFVTSSSSTDPDIVCLDTRGVSCNSTFSSLLVPAPALTAKEETPLSTCLQIIYPILLIDIIIYLISSLLLVFCHAFTTKYLSLIDNAVT